MGEPDRGLLVPSNWRKKSNNYLNIRRIDKSSGPPAGSAVPVHFDSPGCYGAILTAAILQAEGRILRADGQPSLPRLQDSSDAVKYDERCRARAQK